MPKFKDITGQRFGRLVVIERVHPNDARNKVCWLCICDCENFYVASAGTLRQSNHHSCGCRKTNYRHGLTPKHKPHHPLYATWAMMRNRCNNPNNGQYKNYGGRGIKVCERWDDFTVFVSDVGERPHPDQTLDRKNNDLGYFKENVHWATQKEQTNNRRPYKEWDHKYRRIDQFTVAELKSELARRRLNQS